MRIVSWNIEFGIEVERATQDLRVHPDLARADIVLLQEMDRPGTEQVAESFGWNFAYAAAAVFPGTGRELGNAILSRCPIGEAREVPLPHTARVGGQPRSALCAVVDVDGRSIRAYSVHTETVLLPLRRRIDQWAHVAADVERHDDATPTVVGGDFNTASRRAVGALRSVMASGGLTSATSDAGPTFRRFGRDFVLDHVFVDGRMLGSVESVATIVSAASDHRAVRVDLAAEPEDQRGSSSAIAS